jgi:hypothetical protein
LQKLLKESCEQIRKKDINNTKAQERINFTRETDEKREYQKNQVSQQTPKMGKGGGKK